jgi:hypothetical protein
MDTSVNVDCMACIANLAAGCPTNGKACTVLGVTHAMVRSLSNDPKERHNVLPAHVFEWNRVADRWVLFLETMSWWAAREQ